MRVSSLILLILFCVFLGWPVLCQGLDFPSTPPAGPLTETLTNIAECLNQIRSQTDLPVSLRVQAWITLVDRTRSLIVMQDETAAMAVFAPSIDTNWKPGQRIIIRGDGIYPFVRALPTFPDEPCSRDFLDSFEDLSNNETFFIDRIRGFLHPPTTGQYTFWMAADDAGELFLSANSLPERAQKIVIDSIGNATRPREWDLYASERSKPIMLTAGNAYYIEAQHVQGTGGNSLAVAWKGPGIERSVIEGCYLTPWDTPVPTHGLLREVWTNFLARDFVSLNSQNPDESFVRVHAMQLTRIESGEMPAPLQIQPDTNLGSVTNLSWVEMEGDVAFVAGTQDKVRLELKVENSVLTVHILDAAALSTGQLMNSHVRIRGVLEHSVDASTNMTLWVPDAQQVTLLDSTDNADTAISNVSICDINPSDPEMRWGRRVRIRGRIINQTTNGLVVVKGDDNFQAFCSTNGIGWIPIGKAMEIGMSNSILTGLALASHASGSPAEASFTHLQGFGSDWLGASIGQHGHPDAFEMHDGVLTLHGSGRGIMANSDEEFYLYQTKAGESDISVDLSNITDIPEQINHAQTGLMFRESLDSKSCYAAVLFAPVSGAVFQYRNAYNGNSSGFEVERDNQQFRWLRLVRQESLLFVQGTPGLNVDTNELVDITGMIAWHDNIPILKDASFKIASKKISLPQRIISLPKSALTITDFLANAQHPPEPYLYHGMQVSKLQGIITFCGDVLGSNVLFIQEEDKGAIQLGWPKISIKPTFEVGQSVEVAGNAHVRRFPVVLELSSIKTMGWGSLPEPVAYSSALIENNSMRGYWVETTGVIRSEQTNGLFNLMTHDGSLPLWLGQRHRGDDNSYLNALVRVRGVLSIDAARKPCLLVPSAEFVEVQERPPVDPFAIPSFSIADLAGLDAKPEQLRRMKASGVVTCVLPNGIYIQDHTGGLFVENNGPVTVHPGDGVEVVGFPDYGFSPLKFSGALIRRGKAVGIPNSVHLSSNGSIKKKYAGTLVSLEATVLEERNTPKAQMLTLKMGAGILEAARISDENGRLPAIPEGSHVNITGVCQMGQVVADIEIPESEMESPVNSLIIWLPTSADVTVLERPPWWTLKRVAWLGVTFAFGLLVTLVWVWMLRRSVAQKSCQLQATMQRLEKERLTSAVLAERGRLAGEIHDSVEQGLTAIMLQLDAANKHADQSHDVSRFVNLARNMAEFSRAEVQHAVWDMQSPLLANAGLNTALKLMANQICSDSPDIKVEIIGDSSRPLSSSCEHHLLRIAQEAITNAVKHANAQNINVVLDYTGIYVKLSISDDGGGFDLAAVKQMDQTEHFGLHGIRARAKKIDAQFEIASQPAKGTILTVQIKSDNEQAVAVLKEGGPL
jgi:signal transduction histidine kinase